MRARQFIEQNYPEYTLDHSEMSGSMLRYMMEEYSKVVNKQLEVKLMMAESENNSLRLKIEREIGMAISNWRTRRKDTKGSVKFDEALVKWEKGHKKAISQSPPIDDKVKIQIGSLVILRDKGCDIEEEKRKFLENYKGKSI